MLEAAHQALSVESEIKLTLQALDPSSDSVLMKALGPQTLTLIFFPEMLLELLSVFNIYKFLVITF